MMRAIDLSPLYRSAIGFDHLATMLNNATRTEQKQPAYPPYNIELLEENHYRISMAVAGFEQSQLSVEVEKDTLTVQGQKPEEDKDKTYLYQGIAARNFERRFQLAEHIKVKGAKLTNGVLHIDLEREIPEEHKPRFIDIQSDDSNILVEGTVANSVKDTKVA